MAYSEDHIALAAEYALGTLDTDERTLVETMMADDQDFATLVAAWEHRLGVLNQMVGSVEPRPELWQQIRVAAGLAEPQVPSAPAEAPASAAVSPPSPPLAAPDSDNVVRLSNRVRLWRQVAALTTAIAAALVALVAIGIYRPRMLPDQLRPAPRTQVVAIRTPAEPAAPDAQYVAVLQKDGESPAFILTVDGAIRNFSVRRIGAAAEPGKSFELWLISDKLAQPRSLGVVGAGDFTTRPAPASYDAQTIRAATYAVTIEQAGGSPDGKPTSAPVFTGKLVETVPPATQAPASPR
jgi:anti-sigma-K factor RskA